MILRRMLLAVLVLVVVLVAAVFVLVRSGAGLELAWQLATRQIDGLSARDVSGSLLGPITVEGLEYRAGESDYAAERLELAWKPRALLDRRLHVERLVLEEPRVRLAPGEGPDPGAPSSLPAIDLPVSVQVDQLRVVSLRVERGSAQPVELARIEARGASLDEGVVSLARLHAEAAQGQLTLSGRVDTRRDYQGRVEASASGELDGESIAADVLIDGSTRLLDATVTLTQPLTARLEGQVADVLDTLHFDASLDVAPVDAGRLQLAALGEEAQASVHAAGTLSAVTVDGWLRLDDRRFDIAPAAVAWRDGRITVDGLEITRQQRAGRFQISGHVAMAAGPAGPEWQAQVRADSLSASWVRDAWDATPVSGTVGAGGDTRRVRASGTLNVAGHDLGIESLAVERAGDGVSLSELELWVPALQGRLSADAHVGTGGAEPRWRASAGWDSLSVPLAGQSLWLRDGRLQAQGVGMGRDSTYAVNARSRAEGPVPPGDWTLRGSGDADSFGIDALEAMTMDGRLALAGDVGWSDGIRWNLDLDAQRLNPGTWRAGWPGDLALSATSTGAFDGGPRDIALRVATLEGTLRGRSLNASGTFTSADGGAWSGELEVHSGDSRISGSGTWGAEVSLEASAAIPALSDFIPGTEGSLDAQVSVQGPRATPNLDGELVLAGLVHDLATANRLNVSVHGSLAPRTPGRVAVTGIGVLVGPVEVSSLGATASGTLDDHAIELELDGPSGLLQARLEGGYADAAWHGRIASLTADPADFRPWILERPAGVAFSQKSQQLERMCLTSEDDAGLCLEASFEPGAGGEAEYELRRLPLGTAARFAARGLGVPLSIEGELSGNGELRMASDGTLLGELDLASERGIVALTDREPALEFGYESFKASAVLEADRSSARASLKLDPDGAVAASVSLDGRPGAYRNVDARLDAHLADLSWLELVVPGAVSTGGRLDAELALSGEPGDPSPSGNLRVENLVAAIPALGIELSEGRLELDARDAARVAVNAGITSGPGRLKASGWLERGEGGWAATLDVTGERFEAANTAAVQGLVSPQLDVALSAQRIRVEGTVDVPSARISGGGGSRVVSASPDVVVVDDATPVESRAGPQLFADIRLRVGDDVKLEAHNFTGQLGGELRIRDSPDSVPTGNGELQVTGTYEAYGQHLNISEGRLVFAGTPVANPGLDIRATRRVEQATVGLRISGTASEPRAEIFSQPAMEEIEALSYLVLGHPLTGSNSEEGGRLSAAALALNLVGGERMAMRVASRFGIDTIEVSGGDSFEDSALLLGKYLSPRLYVGYGVGLLDARNVVRVRYMLSDLWTVVAESGTESRAVLRYSVER